MCAPSCKAHNARLFATFFFIFFQMKLMAFMSFHSPNLCYIPSFLFSSHSLDFLLEEKKTLEDHLLLGILKPLSIILSSRKLDVSLILLVSLLAFLGVWMRMMDLGLWLGA